MRNIENTVTGYKLVDLLVQVLVLIYNSFIFSDNIYIAIDNIVTYVKHTWRQV